MTVTLILALNHQRAKWIARQRGLRPPEWRSAGGAHALRGIRAPETRVIVAASVHERADAAEMLACLEASGIEPEYVAGH